MGYAAEQEYAAQTGLGDDLYPKHRKVTKCPKCGKKMKKAAGLPDHLRDFHGIPTPTQEGE